MLRLNLPAGPLHILCLGAHSDDIEIGCGGTILHLLAHARCFKVTWVVFSSGRVRKREAEASAALFLAKAQKSEVIVKSFQDGFFPYRGAEIKEFLEQLKKRRSPDLIFTHYRHDRHQDHRTISDLTWNTWRDHLIFEYEIPKYDGDLGSPNSFVPLSAQICESKIKNICDIFQSQSNKNWLTPDTFQAMLRLRGIECGAPDKYAEAFYCRKLIFASNNGESEPEPSLRSRGQK
jgi:LmbE family N-acetylglucosaminyl deacetylase